ncbi:hypothetical protein FRACYDRAFT_262028 [Fragilariopsis cylindrus CCMP1102]|uniref:Uncharacterized protein n=1 Tax=Fragilariopsis cylindrus CCMP1102 TaxID=635003 RepID=A0A1E7F8W5_9STRA|nr:hypothetical protein FRACYDRAFT_262028 [Fragilariopsis cylindrus CCMP1102]|eukprot:OEU14618.1 hypothetical protein FRACYDRAFT_262028 [Fragilariopsis cylindrus CCMP1102]
MMTNLSMKRKDTQRWGKRREQREEYTLPHLIKSPTGSTTSSEDYITKTKGSPPTPYSSSSRMQQRFSDLSSARKCLSTTRDSNTQQQHRHQHQHRHNSLSTNKSSHDDPHVFNNSIHLGASIIKRQLSSSNSNDTPPPPPIKEKGNHTTNDNKENLKNCMVQRVSEMDNSTFASSNSGENDGYLPIYLASGFVACGIGLEQKNAAPESPRPLYTNNNKDDDALETSTLDFLANLHVEEEELNLIFNSFEEEQQELCAQSKRRSTSGCGSGNIMTSLMCHKKSSSPSTTTSVAVAAFHVTAAATPFEKMIPPRSSFFDELQKDPAYRHALKAGLLWQSLASQHVRFSALWYDGQEPACPPFGSSKKKPWAYLGRHRVQGDYKLNSLIGNRGSSGRILLHLVVRDVVSLEPIEDICCGCFHPNARGIRTTTESNPRSDDCRDVWIAHRRRAQEKRLLVQEEDSDADSDTDSDDEYAFTTIESLLRHQNKNRVDPSPLGAQGGKSAVSNDNLKFVFGSKPPVYTVFVLESDLYELFQDKLDGSIPASVVLLRHYLKYRIG